METIQKRPQLWILAFLLSFANVLGVMFVAALPELTQYFHISKNQAQATISVYLIGCVLAQFIYPAFAKSLGRKPALYIGGFLTILGSFLCFFSIRIDSFSLLLWGRGITALGAACGPILTSTMLADAYTPAKIKKNLSYLMSFFMLFPSIAIIVGGAVTEHLSWQLCFTFMLVYAIIVIGMCILLPETAKEKSLGHLNLARIAKSYLKEFSYVTAVLYGLIIACAAIFLYVFSAEAPFIARNQLHISAEHFGFYSLIPNLGFFLGGMMSGRLSHKFPAKTWVHIGISGFFFFSLLMLVLFSTGFVNETVLFGLPFLIFFAAAFILPNGQACALGSSEDKAYMSSLLYVLQYFWGFLSICAIGILPSKDPSVLPIIYTSSGSLMIVLWLIARKVRTRTL